MEDVPARAMCAADTSILSAELLKVQRNCTSGGFASTWQDIFAFSCFATPCTFVWFGLHVGATADHENRSFAYR